MFDRRKENPSSNQELFVYVTRAPICLLSLLSDVPEPPARSLTPTRPFVTNAA